MNHIFAIRVFIRVAETQSFRRAAKELSVSSAAVTRSIAYLEQQLRTRLLNRTTRAVSLTEAGHHYLDGYRRILEELDCLDASTLAEGRAVAGILRIVATDALPPQAITTLVAGFQHRHPQVRIQLTYSAQGSNNFEERYDAGLLLESPATDVEWVQLSLVTDRLVLCAAPSYLATRATPREPDQLGSHSCITIKSGSAAWRLIGPDGSLQCVTVEPSYTATSRTLLRLAAVAGMGIALLPEPLVARDLEEGLLKRIMPDYNAHGSRKKVSLFYPHRRFPPLPTSAFVTYMLEYAGPTGKAISATATQTTAHAPEFTTTE
ncbi:LysR family transcriptional regulator [Paraburkholderia azotifigens]|uniref:LysR family transcriptional regulator n=1 Tax=Paraburkholderia azotifigens TaxID=2057004 RepID=A0ABU9R317_9BURK